MSAWISSFMLLKVPQIIISHKTVNQRNSTIVQVVISTLLFSSKPHLIVCLIPLTTDLTNFSSSGPCHGPFYFGLELLWVPFIPLLQL